MNIKFCIFTVITLLFLSCKTTNQNTESTIIKRSSNQIDFEKSDYGLIFTTIQVNGKKVKAMIDFGDPNMLQLSSSFVKNEKIDVKKSNAIAKDVQGNTFKINDGIVSEVIIGQWKHKNIEFSSSPGEIESVSSQINTKFDAVVGWGYFSQYFITMNYNENLFLLHSEKPTITNSNFITNYEKNSNYLSVPIEIKSKKVNLIIDTGSPLSVIDSTFYYKNKIEEFIFNIGDEEISLNIEIQDMPILSQINAVGVIGGDFLMKYNIYIDPFEKEITFEK